MQTQPQVLTKKQLIDKINKEQGVPLKDLERLNVAALKKMDQVVPDEGYLLGGDSSESPSGDLPKPAEDTLPSDESGEGQNPNPAPAMPSQNGTKVVAETGGDARPTISETPKSPSPVETEQGQGSSEGPIPTGPRADDVVKEKVLLGCHPVTGKPVYLDEQ